MTITYVTVTYNAAAVLQRTLDSILSQDYPFITHLIIDGASTDGTLQMVDDYIRRSNEAGNGHRIQVMSEPDHGIYDAMNKGIRSLDGDYVCFLNAGDFLPATDSASRIAAAVCPLSSTVKAVSSTIVASPLLSTSRGNRSATACSSATKPSMPAQTSLSPRPTTCAIATPPMSIGASAS